MELVVFELSTKKYVLAVRRVLVAWAGARHGSQPDYLPFSAISWIRVFFPLLFLDLLLCFQCFKLQMDQGRLISKKEFRLLSLP